MVVGFEPGRFGTALGGFGFFLIVEVGLRFCVMGVESGAAVAKKWSNLLNGVDASRFRKREATNDQLARATAMLTNGIRRSSRRSYQCASGLHCRSPNPIMAWDCASRKGHPLLLPVRPRSASGLLTSRTLLAKRGVIVLFCMRAIRDCR